MNALQLPCESSDTIVNNTLIDHPVNDPDKTPSSTPPTTSFDNNKRTSKNESNIDLPHVMTQPMASRFNIDSILRSPPYGMGDDASTSMNCAITTTGDAIAFFHRLHKLLEDFPCLLRIIDGKLQPPQPRAHPTDTMDFLCFLHSAGRLHVRLPFRADPVDVHDPDYGTPNQAAQQKLVLRSLCNQHTMESMQLMNHQRFPNSSKDESNDRRAGVNDNEDQGPSDVKDKDDVGAIVVTSESIYVELEAYETLVRARNSKFTPAQRATWLHFRFKGLANEIDAASLARRIHEEQQANKATFQIIKRLLAPQDEHFLLGLEENNGRDLCEAINSMTTPPVSRRNRRDSYRIKPPATMSKEVCWKHVRGSCERGAHCLRQHIGKAGRDPHYKMKRTSEHQLRRKKPRAHSFSDHLKRSDAKSGDGPQPFSDSCARSTSNLRRLRFGSWRNESKSCTTRDEVKVNSMQPDPDPSNVSLKPNMSLANKEHDDKKESTKERTLEHGDETTNDEQALIIETLEKGKGQDTFSMEDWYLLQGCDLADSTIRWSNKNEETTKWEEADHPTGITSATNLDPPTPDNTAAESAMMITCATLDDKGSNIYHYEEDHKIITNGPFPFSGTPDVKQTRTTPSTTNDTFCHHQDKMEASIGDKVQCSSSSEKWRTMDRRPGFIKLHYDGSGDKHDEWIKKSSIRFKGQAFDQENNLEGDDPDSFNTLNCSLKTSMPIRGTSGDHHDAENIKIDPIVIVDPRTLNGLPTEPSSIAEMPMTTVRPSSRKKKRRQRRRRPDKTMKCTARHKHPSGEGSKEDSWLRWWNSSEPPPKNAIPIRREHEVTDNAGPNGHGDIIDVDAHSGNVVNTKVERQDPPSANTNNMAGGLLQGGPFSSGGASVVPMDMKNSTRTHYQPNEDAKKRETTGTCHGSESSSECEPTIIMNNLQSKELQFMREKWAPSKADLETLHQGGYTKIKPREFELLISTWPHDNASIPIKNQRKAIINGMWHMLIGDREVPSGFISNKSPSLTDVIRVLDTSIQRAVAMVIDSGNSMLQATQKIRMYFEVIKQIVDRSALDSSNKRKNSCHVMPDQDKRMGYKTAGSQHNHKAKATSSAKARMIRNPDFHCEGTFEPPLPHYVQNHHERRIHPHRKTRQPDEVATDKLLPSLTGSQSLSLIDEVDSTKGSKKAMEMLMKSNDVAQPRKEPKSAEEETASLYLDQDNIKDVIRKIVGEYLNKLNIKAGDTEALQRTAEECMMNLFQNAKLCATHAGRKEISPKDMILAREIGNYEEWALHQLDNTNAS